MKNIIHLHIASTPLLLKWWSALLTPLSSLLLVRFQWNQDACYFGSVGKNPGRILAHLLLFHRMEHWKKCEHAWAMDVRSATRACSGATVERDPVAHEPPVFEDGNHKFHRKNIQWRLVKIFSRKVQVSPRFFPSSVNSEKTSRTNGLTVFTMILQKNLAEWLLLVW